MKAAERACGLPLTLHCNGGAPRRECFLTEGEGAGVSEEAGSSEDLTEGGAGVSKEVEAGTSWSGKEGVG